MVEIIRSEEESKEFGYISKIKFDNGSIAYISKKGWNLKSDKFPEINIPWSEINLLLSESLLHLSKSNEISKDC